MQPRPIPKQTTEAGQGLVEYALILVLVAVVVIVVLAVLGPTVGNIFSQIIQSIQTGPSTGVITSVNAERTGSGNGNDVVVSIAVSTNTTVNVSDSQDAAPQNGVACNSSCQVTLVGVGPNAGTVTVMATAGGSGMAPYPVKLP